jgi:hypothetical protein
LHFLHEDTVNSRSPKWKPGVEKLVTAAWIRFRSMNASASSRVVSLPARSRPKDSSLPMLLSAATYCGVTRLLDFDAKGFRADFPCSPRLDSTP